MNTYILIFITSLVFAIAGTPIAKRLALKVGIVDRPSARKLHISPTPLLGGVAIYGAVILALVLFENRFRLHELVSILLGATLVSFMGIWDDRRGLNPWVKLGGQVVATLIIIWSGIVVGVFPWRWFNIGVTIFWFVGIINALNLLDNMDGLSGGVGAVASMFFLVLAAINGQYLVAGLAAALAGACFGFLIYNFNPAQIFMGDAGSLFLGFVLAAVGIKLRFPTRPAFVTWMVPILVLGLPIFDTTLVFISRLRRGLNPLTTPGKDHVSHRLVALGLTHREAVMALYLVCGALGLLAILLTYMRPLEGYAVAAVVAATGAWTLYRLERGFRR